MILEIDIGLKRRFSARMMHNLASLPAAHRRIGSRARKLYRSRRSTIVCLVGGILLTTSLGCATGEDCVGGCRDACGPRFSAACIDDYNAGYAVGYSDGLHNRSTFAVVSDARAAGYADGRSDGEAVRRAHDR